MKRRQKLGKYRIERKLGDGGFATVYQAFDTLEGIRVALKVPHERNLSPELIDEFRKEIRLAAQLKHPHILPLKNADYIQDRLVLAYPLGERTLGDRLQSRMSLPVCLNFAQQMLEAVTFAHDHHVIHCDIKPDNFILFPGGELMLADFGIAKVAERTIRASGSGTLGYCAPEQAMGKPSFRSDVFSLGLVIYRMLSGELPEWPFQWPLPGANKLRRRVHPDLIALLRRAIDLEPRKRFPHAGSMLTAFRRVKSRALGFGAKRTATPPRKTVKQDWKTVQRRQFQHQFGKVLATKYTCSRCEGPVSEAMHACPWCGDERKVHRDGTNFPAECPRCQRGLKLDWEYCPWCYGAGFHVETKRKYSDVRYTARCRNAGCSRKLLMPFMRYCPWCRSKVKRKWKIEGSSDKCPSCGWGVAAEYWSFCPWCAKGLPAK